MSLASRMTIAAPLPVRLKAEDLSAVLNKVPNEAWMRHKHTESGMESAILVSVGGTRNRDFPLSGPVMETPLMADIPLLRRIAYALDIQLSRCRLLRIKAGEHTPPLTDDSYYWYRHAPIYIPMSLPKQVNVVCAEQHLPMQQGEIWHLDPQLPHWIENNAAEEAVFMVLESGEQPQAEGFIQRFKQGAHLLLLAQPGYRFEVLDPEELKRLCQDIKNALQQDPQLKDEKKTQALQGLDTFQQQWAQAFTRFGHDRHGELAYFDAVQDFLEQVFNPAARAIKQQSHAQRAAHIIRSMLWTAPPSPKRLNQQRLAGFHQRRLPAVHWHRLYQRVEHLNSTLLPTQQQRLLRCFDAPITAAAAHAQCAQNTENFIKGMQQLIERKRLQEVMSSPRFERPVFILSAPRAGSTLLFENLCHFPKLWSVGGESHELFETIPALHPQTKDYASNRLLAEDAQADVAAQLIENFSHRLQDRDAHHYLGLSNESRPAAVRFLEKTPKNALRAAFLKAVFPDALFIFLYRDPKENISSMLEGWRSRRFLAYRHMPDWPHKEWHFLLPPGWQQFTNASLVEIASFQWQAANEYALRDLQAMPRSDWLAMSYRTLVERPQDSIQRIRDFAGWEWDERIAERVSQSLPVSHMTLSEPCTEKWRRHEHELRVVLPGLVDLEAQVAEVLKGQW